MSNETLVANLTGSVITATVTAVAGSAGAAIASTTASARLRLRNRSNSLPVEFKVGASGAWTLLLNRQNSDVFALVNLATTQVFLRKAAVSDEIPTVEIGIINAGVPTTDDADRHNGAGIPVGGSSSGGAVASVAGLTDTITAAALKTALSISPADVQLGNVSNTADSAKPVSTPQATAIAAAVVGLAPLASPAFTGTPAAPSTSATDNSTRLATTAMVQAALAASTAGLLDLKTSLDASTSPNYPAALKGDTYIVSVAGKVGGASGKAVDVGDIIVASADSAGGNEAAVGTSWFAMEHNLVGAMLVANNGSDILNTATFWANLGGDAKSVAAASAANLPVSTAQAAAIAASQAAAGAAVIPSVTRVTAVANNGFGVPPPTYLPTVSVAPAAVYGMRKLVSAYSGAILQATRASDSTTIDATQTATGLPNATAVAAFAAGSAVTMSKWYDQSGNTRDAVQAAPANQPIFDAAGLLGQAAASGSFKAAVFDGWLDVVASNTRRPKKMTIPTSVAVEFQNHSIFLVFEPKSALYNSIYYSLARSSGGTSATTVGTAAALAGIYAGGGAANTVGTRRARTQVQVFGTVSGTTSYKFVQDGQTITASNSKWSDPLAGGVIGDDISSSSGDFMSADNFLAMVIYPAALSDTDAAAVVNALNSAFAIPAPTGAQVVMVGDSIQYGATVNESLQGRTITRLVRPLLKGYPALYNMGLSSQLLTGGGGMAANASTREFLLAADGSYSRRVLFSEIGGNDIATNGATAGYAATLYAAYTTYITAARAAGFNKIVLRTILPRNWTGQTAIEWAALNTLIRANTAGADAISDVAADPVMGNVANVGSTAYYQGDSTHPTSYGLQLLAPYDAAAINAVL